MENKYKIGKYLIIIGIILIFSSLVIVVYNSYLELNAGIKSRDVINVMKDNINNDSEVIKLNNNENSDMSVMNIDGYDYIGTIVIPKINLELPVMSDYDNEKLNIAPCRYYGSVYSDDLIICAHSYKTHFKYISNLVQGDRILFIDINGENYVYEVLEIEVLNPDDVNEMIDNDFDLTLYTCTNDGLNRITVRCNRLIDKI